MNYIHIRDRAICPECGEAAERIVRTIEEDKEPLNCSHPWESREDITIGGLHFSAGEVDDTLKEITDCLACGVEVIPEAWATTENRIKHKKGCTQVGACFIMALDDDSLRDET